MVSLDRLPKALGLEPLKKLSLRNSRRRLLADWAKAAGRWPDSLFCIRKMALARSAPMPSGSTPVRPSPLATNCVTWPCWLQVTKSQLGVGPMQTGVTGWVGE